ncbi:MAG: hypothetical protein R6V02_09495 [Candidatus Aminicenantes bacterium]
MDRRHADVPSEDIRSDSGLFIIQAEFPTPVIQKGHSICPV